MRYVWGAVVAVTLCVYAHGAIASEATVKIAAYVGAPERIRYTTESAATSLRQSNPQVASALSRSLSFMKSGEVNERASAVLDKHMTTQEAQDILNFKDTALGVRFGNTLRTALSPQAFSEAVANYPPSDANNPIFSSPAMSHLLGALDSPEWHQAWKEYGEVLMCRAFQVDDPQTFEKVRRQGRCASAQQGVQRDGP